MIFKKIKEIITRKKDQNVKSDALLEEEKNELIIERFIENSDIFKWNSKDIERFENSQKSGLFDSKKVSSSTKEKISTLIDHVLESIT